MATKIGFDAKLAGTGVDWATVGKDVSETLIQQEQQREKIVLPWIRLLLMKLKH